MCCNTKAGPRIALQHLSNAAGLQLTQEDWHQMRAYSGEFLGRELSSGRATASESASAAVRLMHQFAGSDAEMQEFARSFAIATNTQGTIDTLNVVAHQGFPATVAHRNLRGDGLPGVKVLAMTTEVPERPPFDEAGEGWILSYRVQSGSRKSEKRDADVARHTNDPAAEEAYVVALHSTPVYNFAAQNVGTGKDAVQWVQDMSDFQNRLAEQAANVGPDVKVPPHVR